MSSPRIGAPLATVPASAAARHRVMGQSTRAAHLAARAVNAPGVVSCSSCLPARRATRLEVTLWVGVARASGAWRGAAIFGQAGERLIA